MKKTLALLALLAACGEPYTDVDDIEVEQTEQELYTASIPPLQLLFSIADNGIWKGVQAGQPYHRWNSTDHGDGRFAYNKFGDNQVNSAAYTGHWQGTCRKLNQVTVACEGVYYTCPQGAVVVGPKAWRNGTSGPWTYDNIRPWRDEQWNGILGGTVAQNPSVYFSEITLASGVRGTAINCIYPAPPIYVKRF